MTVSIEKTSKRYRGKMARGYETKRKTQYRWDIENKTVEDMLKLLRPETVLDVPVGTGRFLKVYQKLGILNVTGIDSSEEMLELAHRKRIDKTANYRLRIGDARKLAASEKSHDVAVCVRFLDLIDEEAMREVVKELCRVAVRAIILTIRLGPKYIPKSNTATHDSNKFRALVRSQGFNIIKEVPVLNAGWQIMRLERRSK